MVPVLGPQNDIVRHRPVLPHKDVAAAIETVRASEFWHAAVKLAFEFLVLTAARSGEVGLVTWAGDQHGGGVPTPSTALTRWRPHRAPLAEHRPEPVAPD